MRQAARDSLGRVRAAFLFPGEEPCLGCGGCPGRGSMCTRSAMPICEIRGCGELAAIMMQAPAEAPGKEHVLCEAHAAWMATKLRRAGVGYTSRPLAAV